MEVPQLIGKDWREWIKFLVDYDPRAVFNWIQANYRSPLPNWAMGFEASSGNKLQMQRFLEDKAGAATNTAQYLVALFKSIPAKK